MGIGASAGGLKALQGFFEHMPPDNGLAFVVVQHLDPKHESIVSSILARHTAASTMESLQVELDMPRLGRRRVSFAARCLNPEKPSGLILLAMGLTGG